LSSNSRVRWPIVLSIYRAEVTAAIAQYALFRRYKETHHRGQYLRRHQISRLRVRRVLRALLCNQNGLTQCSTDCVNGGPEDCIRSTCPLTSPSTSRIFGRGQAAAILQQFVPSAARQPSSGLALFLAPLLEPLYVSRAWRSAAVRLSNRSIIRCRVS
jgi:hypothetical protein